MNARVVKNPDERRLELLETAFRLFCTRSYDRVAVQDITDAVGVAKGTFYHYFRSKVDLLAQVADWQVDALIEGARAVVRAAPADALSRFRAAVGLFGDWKLDNREFIRNYLRALYTDENQLLRLKLQERYFERFAPVLAEIVTEGVAEGSFVAADPAGATQAVLWLWSGMGEWMVPRILALEQTPGDVDALIASMKASEQACERILGAADGSLRLFDYDQLRALALEVSTALSEPAAAMTGMPRA
jgi:AcrR family transcriptional regulator